MKALLLILAALSIVTFVQAEEVLPPDVQRVVDQRAAAVAKIDKIYLQELEKLKVTYTKQGNLEVANTVMKLIEAVEMPTVAKEPLVGRWSRVGKPGRWVFRPDGTGDFTSPGKLEKILWKKKSDTEYGISFPSRPEWNSRLLLSEQPGEAYEVLSNEVRIKTIRDGNI
jgi:hypothetical protein